jgi:hypothetical protein
MNQVWLKLIKKQNSYKEKQFHKTERLVRKILERLYQKTLRGPGIFG